ncbi:unnamed protein product [Zymoseptoria tritici ST99CH_1E4]|uniref:Uncharacterized protein n=1 Tax=Zymoseptoria tritici ST99CH_1E4 TaxID=1276532 RepID=A0A2H1H7V9_ZYMTR|nr:unnamed protein product [Zymoseptoria tritici ST99CH_1E4]
MLGGLDVPSWFDQDALSDVTIKFSGKEIKCHSPLGVLHQDARSQGRYGFEKESLAAFAVFETIVKAITIPEALYDVITALPQFEDLVPEARSPRRSTN